MTCLTLHDVCTFRWHFKFPKICQQIVQILHHSAGQKVPRTSSRTQDLVRDIIQIVWVSAKMHNFQWNCIIIGCRGSKRVNVSTISTYWCSCLLFNGTRLKNWLAMSQLIQICIIFSFFYLLHHKTVSIMSSDFTRFKLPCIVYCMFIAHYINISCIKWHKSKIGTYLTKYVHYPKYRL